MEAGILYLVPTPIGNLGDMTYRAVEVLKSVELIACEDTRTSLKLLNHYEIRNKLVSYHKFNEAKQTQALLEQLKSGSSVALITDAGTPAISDPASHLVSAVIRENIIVTCLPGATAFVPALAASGLDTHSFTFAGFLPLKAKERKAILQKLSQAEQTVILYEAPHRLDETLDELISYFGDRRAVIARELSKLHETFYRGTLTELKTMQIDPRGEFVLLISGAMEKELTDTELTSLIKSKIKQGWEGKELIQALTSETNISRNRLYKLYLTVKKES
jgi:16S rRNA (cytidine1402-2'-O)-methyltransferase